MSNTPFFSLIEKDPTSGGGGGASLNGFNSGKGGDGGAGWVRVITYYD